MIKKHNELSLNLMEHLFRDPISNWEGPLKHGLNFAPLNMP